MAEAAHATSLVEPIVLLATAVVAVPIFKRAGLGAVLGRIAAGAGRAQLIVVCTDLQPVTDRIVRLLGESFPGTPCVVRSFDRRHSLGLLSQGVVEVRETFDSALLIGREALGGLGVAPVRAELAMADVRRRDRARLEAQRSGGLMAGGNRFQVQPEPLAVPEEAKP